ncbi:hypothetical protein [Mucilaginibacter sp.]|uniref:hypothetical protein n=1 Tax=Mucilaginibacter sp. TaxID=1882438 RepID=UPI0028456709|nr:hypothetical protein [Mucilaginibacter sp.]MDR3694033.1 hypothetical protein [Mucilaginibacter sp.]
MNSRVQRKLAELKRKTDAGKINGLTVVVRKEIKRDGLSMAIHSQKDADQFISELSAIRRRRTAR